MSKQQITQEPILVLTRHEIAKLMNFNDYVEFTEKVIQNYLPHILTLSIFNIRWEKDLFLTRIESYFVYVA